MEYEILKLELLNESLGLFHLSNNEFSCITQSDLKAVYRKCLKENHPDNHPGEEEYYLEQTKLLNNGYEFLNVYKGWQAGSVKFYVEEFGRKKEHAKTEEEAKSFSNYQGQTQEKETQNSNKLNSVLLKEQHVLNQALAATMRKYGIGQAKKALYELLFNADYNYFTKRDKEDDNFVNYREMIMQISLSNVNEIVQKIVANVYGDFSQTFSLEQYIDNYVNFVLSDKRVHILDTVSGATYQKYGIGLLTKAHYSYIQNNNARGYTRSIDGKFHLTDNLRFYLIQNIPNTELLDVMRTSLILKGEVTNYENMDEMILAYDKMIQSLFEIRKR